VSKQRKQLLFSRTGSAISFTRNLTY